MVAKALTRYNLPQPEDPAGHYWNDTVQGFCVVKANQGNSASASKIPYRAYHNRSRAKFRLRLAVVRFIVHIP